MIYLMNNFTSGLKRLNSLPGSIFVKIFANHGTLKSVLAPIKIV